MVDVKKITRIIEGILHFAKVHDIYLVFEVQPPQRLFALLKTLNAKVKGILDPPKDKKFPYPAVSFDKAEFNDKIGIIYISAKALNRPDDFLKFTREEKVYSIHCFVLSADEIEAIYDMMMVIRVIQQCKKDGFTPGIYDFGLIFGCGVSMFLNPKSQGFAVQAWNRDTYKLPKYDIDDTAIVIQGPLTYADDYTITTVQLYREWYPNVTIIISTWKKEATKSFRDECKKNSVVLLENDTPSVSGYGHVNYQIESSHQGVEYVKNNLNVKYVLKTRTDQRFNRIDFLIYFKNLLRLFPPNTHRISKRIIALSSLRWTPFYVRDYMYFGTVEDISKLFSIPHQTQECGDYFLRKQATFYKTQYHLINKALLLDLHKAKTPLKLRNFNIMMDKLYPAEVFISKSFYNLYIEPIEPARLLQTYWKYLRDCLIIVDYDSLLMHWEKYSYRRYFAENFYYHEIDHARWLDIYFNYRDDE